MEKVIIIGATSGIGWNVADILNKKGYSIGIAGRRCERLENFKAERGGVIETAVIDVTKDDASANLLGLAERMGGVDTIILCSGIGCQNVGLEMSAEIATTQTNVVGFTRMIDTAFNYFKENGGGHIAAVSSIAGTKGLGVAPAYSATKRFQNTYIQCLAQLSSMVGAKVTFTDIRPGFVDTDLLKSGHFPMMMRPEFVADKIVNAVEHKKRVITIDWKYRLLVAFWRLIPNFIWEKLKIVKTEK